MKQFIENMRDNVLKQIEGRMQVVTLHRKEIDRHAHQIHMLEHELIGMNNQKTVCEAILSHLKEKEHGAEYSGSDSDQVDFGDSHAASDIDVADSEFVSPCSVEQ